MRWEDPEQFDISHIEIFSSDINVLHSDVKRKKSDTWQKTWLFYMYKGQRFHSNQGTALVTWRGVQYLVREEEN